MTGKLADTVMSVRNGEQIARKYQPVVFNPSTPAQVETRAKMKLMSQLSAVVSPIIAFRRQGNVSSRNIFVKKNFALATYSEGESDINLNSLDITGGIIGIPMLNASIAQGVLSVNLATSDAAIDIDRMVYCALTKDENGKLRYIGSAVSSTPGVGNLYEATIPVGTNTYVVLLAYGVRDNTENAKAIFGNMQAPRAEQIAKLVVSSTLTESDVTLTETKAVTLTPGA